jgi:hypothetical protein
MASVIARQRSVGSLSGAVASGVDSKAETKCSLSIPQMVDVCDYVDI